LAVGLIRLSGFLEIGQKKIKGNVKINKITKGNLRQLHKRKEATGVIAF
jgi:hypothetical protein